MVGPLKIFKPPIQGFRDNREGILSSCSSFLCGFSISIQIREFFEPRSVEGREEFQDVSFCNGSITLKNILTLVRPSLESQRRRGICNSILSDPLRAQHDA